MGVEKQRSLLSGLPCCSPVQASNTEREGTLSVVMNFFASRVLFAAVAPPHHHNSEKLSAVLSTSLVFPFRWEAEAAARRVWEMNTHTNTCHNIKMTHRTGVSMSALGWCGDTVIGDCSPQLLPSFYLQEGDTRPGAGVTLPNFTLPNLCTHVGLLLMCSVILEKPVTVTAEPEGIHIAACSYSPVVFRELLLLLLNTQRNRCRKYLHLLTHSRT